MSALDETHGQKHISDKPGDQLPVFAWLIDINAIDRIRVIEYEPPDLERHAVLAVVLLRFPVVPLEFVVAYFIPVCRVTSKLRPLMPATCSNHSCIPQISGANVQQRDTLR
jgi:hypothetical protein